MIAEQLQRRFPERLGTLRTAQKHAKALVERGLLARAPIRSLLPTFSHVYFTTPHGLTVIDEVYRRQTGWAWPGGRGEQHRPSRLYNVNHIEQELALTDPDLAIHRTVSTRPDVTLANTVRRYHQELSFRHKQKQVVVRPDAGYDVIHERQGRTWLDACFVELDRGTCTQRHWRDKMRRYDRCAASPAGAQYLAGLHQQYRDGSTYRPNFRLLVVTHAHAREGDNLHRLVVLLTECLQLSDAMQARIWATRYSDIGQNVDEAIWFRW